MGGDEGEGLLGILGRLILNLRRHDDALHGDRRPGNRLRPRQVGEHLLDIVLGEILLNDRTQMVLGAVPPRAELIGDVGGKARISQQRGRRHQRIDGRRVIPPNARGPLLDVDDDVGQRDLARTRHHFNTHDPIISRRADTADTKKTLTAATLL